MIHNYLHWKAICRILWWYLDLRMLCVYCLQAHSARKLRHRYISHPCNPYTPKWHLRNWVNKMYAGLLCTIKLKDTFLVPVLSHRVVHDAYGCIQPLHVMHQIRSPLSQPLHRLLHEDVLHGLFEQSAVHELRSQPHHSGHVGVESLHLVWVQILYSLLYLQWWVSLQHKVQPFCWVLFHALEDFD